MRNLKRIMIFILIITFCIMPYVGNAYSIIREGNKTNIKQFVRPIGEYSNWEGVPSVSHFVDKNGKFCFAYKVKNKVCVVTTNKGKIVKKTFLDFKRGIFGAVAKDANDNYYVVYGLPNKGNDTSQNTIFIAKYNSKGQFVEEVGDNGSSSLFDYYDDGFYTKTPFMAGNCSVAINGNILAVNYARHMYCGHQSNSVFAIDLNTMSKIYYKGIYNSHSFGQKAVKFRDGFVFASEGDCYDRAFTVNTTNSDSLINTGNLFHFWVKKGTFEKYDMFTLNNNFAHIGNLINIDDKKVAFVATSAKDMGPKAKKQKENVFIQIFDPTLDLSKKESYITDGERKGTSGKNGDEPSINYGVQWLTNSKSGITKVQGAYDGKGNLVVLFEERDRLYFMVLDNKGRTVVKKTLYSKKAQLNECERPIVSDGVLYWVANRRGDNKNKLHIYSLEVNGLQ